MQRFLNKLFYDQVVRKMAILGDNKISFVLTKNLESQNCIKHIDIIHYHIWGLVDDGKCKRG